MACRIDGMKYGKHTANLKNVSDFFTLFNEFYVRKVYSYSMPIKFTLYSK